MFDNTFSDLIHNINNLHGLNKTHFRGLEVTIFFSVYHTQILEN